MLSYIRRNMTGNGILTALSAVFLLIWFPIVANAQVPGAINDNRAAGLGDTQDIAPIADPLPGKHDRVSNEILVGLRADVTASPATRGRLERAVGGSMIRFDKVLNIYRIRVRPSLGIDAAINRVGQLSEVAFAEPNYVLSAVGATPNDASYASQWAPTKIQMPDAWPLWNPQVTTIIAIIDTGVQTNHPDLVNKMYRDNQGNIVGYNYVANTTNANDDHGHGTHCAGIAAAQINNAAGVAGIAGWDGIAGNSNVAGTKIMPIKALDASGNGFMSNIASGVTYAADHGAKIISMSLGSTAVSTTLQNAVNYAWTRGCIVVAAAGNSGTSSLTYPAAYTNVVSVAATGSGDALSYFSNWGSWVSVAAPGESIYSTHLNNGYTWMSGTSMATPHVAGELALLASQNPALTNSSLRSIVINNVDPVGTYTDANNVVHSINAGRINVLRALQAAAPQSVPSAPTNLTAMAVSRLAIDLGWTNNAAATATRQRVQFSLDNISWSDLGVTNASAVNLSALNLSSGTRYYFRLRAENAAGGSTWSNTANARTTRR